MKFEMVHENYNVADLDRSLAFYEKVCHNKNRNFKGGFFFEFSVSFVQQTITIYFLDLNFTGN